MTTLRAAVQNESISSKQGLLQRLFAVWFDAFVYNQIWEDPRVDLQALRLDDDSRVLTISSGGCNALNCLLKNPALTEELRGRFVYEKELSENLFKQDRLSIYGGFHLYVKN